MDTVLIDTPDFQLTQFDFIIRFVIALGVGFLIGLEREHAAMKQKEEVFAGIRSFMFVVTLGFMAALLHFLFSPFVFLGILIAVITLIVISYWITASKGDIGGTTEFSAIIAFVLGILLFMGLIEISLMITVVIVFLLSSKLKIQTAIGKITAEELYDFIRFVTVILLLYPFLPDGNFGPYNVINLKEIAWIIILTSGLGLVGYAMMKFLGPGRGILLTGVIGGFVSSTVVTWVFAKKSKTEEALSLNCAIAILAASSIMMIRIWVWIFLFNQELLPVLTAPLGLMFLSAIGITLFFYFKQKKSTKVDTEMKQGKPLNLQGAFVFGFIYLMITLVVTYAADRFGNEGIYISSAIAGFSDIDAITISVSKLAGNTLALHSAVNAILIAAISNTFVKTGIAVWAGSKKLRSYLYLGYGVIFLSAIVAILIANN